MAKPLQAPHGSQGGLTASLSDVFMSAEGSEQRPNPSVKAACALCPGWHGGAQPQSALIKAICDSILPLECAEEKEWPTTVFKPGDRFYPPMSWARTSTKNKRASSQLSEIHRS